MDDLVKRLRGGVIEHQKRWSGDTHTDLGGSADYDATGALMDEAAVRIEALTAERNVWRETLHSMTPRGSEYTTPEECASFVTQEREKRHKIRVERVLANREMAALTAETERLQERVAALEGALRPFSDMAGEMFARNWSKDGVAVSFVTPDGPIRLTFSEFLSARDALRENSHD